jgi:hypothetical protein
MCIIPHFSQLGQEQKQHFWLSYHVTLLKMNSLLKHCKNSFGGVTSRKIDIVNSWIQQSNSLAAKHNGH